MILKANQKYIDTSSIAHLLVNGEKNADTINLQVDRYYHDIDLSTCDFILRAVNENQNLIDQTLEKSINDDTIILKWVINEYFTAMDGKLLLEIRAIEGDNLILKYVMSPIYVKSSATGEGLPSLDTVEKALDDMQKLLEQAQDIAVKVPYLSGGTWWVWDIAQNTYVDTGTSAQGQKGDTGEKGQDGLNGRDGKDGTNGIDGKNGTNGIDGISPTISVAENTTSSYILTINDANGSFNTPNLKGADGSSGSISLDENFDYSAHSSAPSTAFFTRQNTIVTQRISTNTDKIASLEETISSIPTITVDVELSETSENPVQNKAITKNLSTIQAEIVKLNDLIKNLPSGETSVTTLFSSSNYEQYLDGFNFKSSQWDDTVYTFQQAIKKVSSLCSETYNYQIRLSTDFGWSANVTILCLTPLELNATSRLLVNYNCSTAGSNISVEVLSSADFTSESIATFEDIPSLYAGDDTYMSVNLFPKTTIESGTYYLRFKYTTVNPVFLIKSIEVIS